MTNEEMLEQIKDIAEVVILNVDENTKKEIKKYTSTLESELIKQRKQIEQLESIVNNSIDNIAKDETVQKLIEILVKIVD